MSIYTQFQDEEILESSRRIDKINNLIDNGYNDYLDVAENYNMVIAAEAKFQAITDFIDSVDLTELDEKASEAYLDSLSMLDVNTTFKEIGVEGFFGKAAKAVGAVAIGFIIGVLLAIVLLPITILAMAYGILSRLIAFIKNKFSSKKKENKEADKAEEKVIEEIEVTINDIKENGGEVNTDDSDDSLDKSVNEILQSALNGEGFDISAEVGYRQMVAAGKVNFIFNKDPSGGYVVTPTNPEHDETVGYDISSKLTPIQLATILPSTHKKVDASYMEKYKKSLVYHINKHIFGLSGISEHIMVKSQAMERNILYVFRKDYEIIDERLGSIGFKNLVKPNRDTLKLVQREIEELNKSYVARLGNEKSVKDAIKDISNAVLLDKRGNKLTYHYPDLDSAVVFEVTLDKDNPKSVKFEYFDNLITPENALLRCGELGELQGNSVKYTLNESDNVAFDELLERGEKEISNFYIYCEEQKKTAENIKEILTGFFKNRERTIKEKLSDIEATNPVFELYKTSAQWGSFHPNLISKIDKANKKFSHALFAAKLDVAEMYIKGKQANVERLRKLFETLQSI